LIPLCGSAAGLLLYLAYNYLRFGHPLRFGQPYSFSLKGAPEGVVGLLLSPGRGLLWYCPVAITLIGLSRRTLRNPKTLLVLSVAGCYFLMYSSWYIWWGERCWGPRLLLPVLPGLMALTGLLDRKWRPVLVSLTLVGFIASSPNLISFYQRYCQEMKDAGLTEEVQAWSWPHVPLVGIWGSSYREIRDARGTGDIQAVVHQAGSEVPCNTQTTRAFHVVAIWWWLLPAAGIPRIFGAIVTLVLVGLSALTIAFALHVTRNEARSF